MTSRSDYGFIDYIVLFVSNYALFLFFMGVSVGNVRGIIIFTNEWADLHAAFQYQVIL